MAESTGRFPPTPTLHKAAKQPIAAKLGDPAAMSPKTEVMAIVRLNAHRRPKRSPVDVSHVWVKLWYSATYVHPKPQNIAPTSNPIFCDNERSGGFEGANSLVTAGRIKEVTIGQRLSLAQPNPTQRISNVPSQADIESRVKTALCF